MEYFWNLVNVMLYEGLPQDIFPNPHEQKDQIRLCWKTFQERPSFEITLFRQIKPTFVKACKRKIRLQNYKSS